ncbi:MAG: Cache 3/Cache 2 fusion domain-containing protein [Proteobacteria bacterium]|nr:Cache 3/Cache 2 fusion domain-containing protein [Pseudomonadota bacterium]MCH8976716.1 Cache 3/Cache 2 fusion domain-containing protein [Pseudomonadota bacterium]
MNKLTFYPFTILKIVLALLLTLTAGIAFAAQDSTVFTFDGQDFIRVSTTLTTADSKSAVNTKLNRNDPSYKALIQKHSYTGDATINGKNYDSYYAPLTDDQGQLTGAIFVGNSK